MFTTDKEHIAIRLKGNIMMGFNPNKYNLREMVKEFGIPLVFVTSFSRVLRMLKVPRALVLKYESIKHGIISNYLLNKYKKSLKTEGFSNQLIEKDCPIWVCWWQGYDNAPSIVRSCINSIYRNAGEHKVILVTRDNYKEYAKIPGFILDKLNRGLISNPQFSDILRVSLLTQHGGVWIDSTCYMLNPLPEHIYSRSYYTLHGANKGWPWTDFFQICGKSNIYMNNMMNVFYEYWSEHNQLLTYLLIDCFMTVMYRSIPYFKKAIDELPPEDFGVWKLSEIIDEPYDKEILESLKENTVFSKLSYKEKHIDYKDGKETFWHYLKEECVRER